MQGVFGATDHIADAQGEGDGGVDQEAPKIALHTLRKPQTRNGIYFLNLARRDHIGLTTTSHTIIINKAMTISHHAILVAARYTQKRS